LAINTLSKVQNRIVAVSVDKFTTDLMTRAIRAGAKEVLIQPVQEDEVHEIINKTKIIHTNQVETQPSRDGKVIICFSSKGGVGKTTLSCNLSVLLAQRLGPGRVALIDANTQAPNIQPMLDLRPANWLRDAILEYKRLDSEMLRQLMTRHDSGLDVLAHSSDNPLGLDFTEDQLSKIILVAKGTYDYIFVDTFPLLSSLNLAMMDLADKVLLVTESVVPALRSAKYNLQMLDQAGYGQNRIDLVLNRYAHFRGNVNPEFVSETLNWPINHVLPYTSDATIAANNGKAVVTMFPNNNLTNGLNKLLDDISGKSKEEERDGLFTSFSNYIKGLFG
jgi:pilus assembly protein CpaE